MGLLDKFFGPPSREAFAREVMDGLRAVGRGPLRYDASEFKILGGEKGDDQIYLGNVYDEYCAAARADRKAVVARFVRAVAMTRDIPTENVQDALPRLRPRVRERCYLDVRRLMVQASGREAPELPHRVLGESFIVTLACDFPDSMVEVSKDMLSTWGLSFDDALGRARENLWDASKERLRQVAPGVWLSPWRDNYDASRLVLHDLVWQHEVRGAHVALAPNRDTLVVTGSEDAAGLGRAFALAEAALQEPRPMGGRPLLLEKTAWVPFALAAGHPQFAGFRKLELMTLSRDYAEQKDLLEASLARKGEDVFVATYNAVQRQDGALSSYAAWSDGVTTLLPVSEQVAFIRPSAPKEGQILGMAPWARVRSVAADLMTPMGLYPERFRVGRFPPQDQLSRILG